MSARLFEAFRATMAITVTDDDSAKAQQQDHLRPPRKHIAMPRRASAAAAEDRFARLRRRSARYTLAPLTV